MADATIYSGRFACVAWVGSVTSILIYLTHWGHDNMAVILQTEFYRFLLWKLYFYSNFTEISSRAINNRAALAQTIAGRQTGNRPLSEPTMVYFTATYMRHSTSTYIYIYIYIFIYIYIYTPLFSTSSPPDFALQHSASQEICTQPTIWSVYTSHFISRTIFHQNSNSMEHSICSHPDKWSLWNFAHGTTAVLLWHVQKFVSVWHVTMQIY